MPVRKLTPTEADPHLAGSVAASHLPDALQAPAGGILSMLVDLLGGGQQLPGPAPMGTAVWKGAGKAAEVAEPELKSLAKTLGDLYNRIFVPKPGAGLPRRMRFTGTTREGAMQFHNASPGAPIGPAPFESTPAEVDSLINSGMLDVEQPPIRATNAIQQRLRETLDANLPQYKTEQFKRGSSKSAKP